MKQSKPLALALVIILAAPAFASVPAPAAPPDALPALVGGLDGLRVWTDFSYGVRFAAVDRIDAAATASLLGPRDQGDAIYLDRVGPTLRAAAGFQEMSFTLRYERVCERRADDFYNRSSDRCQWQARLFRLGDLGAIDQVARDRFDVDAVTAELAASGTTPTSFSGVDAALLGLAPDIHADLDELVRMQVVDETACPAVLDVIEATRDINPFSLDMTEGASGDLVTYDGPPPSPIGLRFTLTFPINGYEGIEGELTVRAGPTPQALGLAAVLRGDVQACFGR